MTFCTTLAETLSTFSSSRHANLVFVGESVDDDPLVAVLYFVYIPDHYIRLSTPNVLSQETSGIMTANVYIVGFGIARCYKRGPYS